MPYNETTEDWITRKFREQKKLEMRRYRWRKKYDPYGTSNIVMPSDEVLDAGGYCERCEIFFMDRRQNSKYCSPSCKQKAYRERVKSKSG